MKLSELRTAGEIQKEDMQDLGYRREYERTRLANEVAIQVIHYRVTRGLSQTALARELGWRQPNVARLEAGDHEPTVATLAHLSDKLGLEFTIEIKNGRVTLRNPPAGRRVAAGKARPARVGGKVRDLPVTAAH